MFTVQDFINVFSKELRMGASNSDYCTRRYNNCAIHYIVYNEKLEITIHNYTDKRYSHYTMTYDECMDWVVMSKHGVHGTKDSREHYKRVSQDHSVVTQEQLQQIKLIKENMAFDHAHDMIRSKMKSGKD